MLNLLSGSICDPDVVRDPDWAEYWDQTLARTVRSTKREWEACAYDEELHNWYGEEKKKIIFWGELTKAAEVRNRKKLYSSRFLVNF